MSDKINGLKIILNDCDYPDGGVYLSLGIGFGFCTHWLKKRDSKELAMLNGVSGNCFVNMVMMLLEEQGIKVGTSVFPNAAVLSITTDAKSLERDGRILFESVFNLPFTESRFEQAKIRMASRFSANWKNDYFQAQYKMMEECHWRKDFHLARLLNEIKDISAEDFQACLPYIHFSNSCCYLAGSVQELKSHPFLKMIETMPAGRKTSEKRFYPQKDIFTRQDDHCVEVGHQGVSVGLIRFDFLNPDVAVVDREVLLAILGEIQFRGKNEVHCDAIDAGITYFDTPKKRYKYELYPLLEEEAVKRAGAILFHRYVSLMQDRPGAFGAMAVNHYFCNSDLMALLSRILYYNAEQLKALFNAADPKISEAQVILEGGRQVG